MPIVFQQPAPVMPNVSMGYGAAEQFSRDLPTLAGMQEAAAKLAQSSALAGQHSQDAYSANAERAREFDLGQRQESNLYDAQLGTQANLAMYHGAQQLTMQQQHFELQNWLQDQDITRQEQVQQRQIAGGLAELQDRFNKKQISLKDYNQGVSDLKTPFLALKQKELATNTRLAAAKTKQAEADATASATFNGTVGKMFASGDQPGLRTYYDEDMFNQVSSEYDAGASARAAMGIPEDPKVRDKVIRKVLSDRPGGVIGHAILDADGKKITMLKKDGSGTDAETAHKNNVHGWEARGRMASQKLESWQKRAEVARKSINEDINHFGKSDAEKEAIIASRVGPKPDEFTEPFPERADQRPTAKKAGAPAAAPTGQSAAPAAAMANPAAAGGAAAAVATPEKLKAQIEKPLPDDPKEWTPLQRALAAQLDTAQNEISNDTGLRPEIRVKALAILEKGGAILKSGVDDEKKKTEVKALKDQLAALLKAPAAAPQAPAAAPVVRPNAVIPARPQPTNPFPAINLAS